MSQLGMILHRTHHIDADVHSLEAEGVLAKHPAGTQPQLGTSHCPPLTQHRVVVAGHEPCQEICNTKAGSAGDDKVHTSATTLA